MIFIQIAIIRDHISLHSWVVGFKICRVLCQYLAIGRHKSKLGWQYLWMSFIRCVTIKSYNNDMKYHMTLHTIIFGVGFCQPVACCDLSVMLNKIVVPKKCSEISLNCWNFNHLFSNSSECSVLPVHWSFLMFEVGGGHS